MEAILLFVNILFWLCVLALVLGMIQPWWVFWFLDRQNRLMVLKYYGSLVVLLMIARSILIFLTDSMGV
ncbi:MAG: hypothetical protein JJU28_00795 [Cyclobacteriaceae bacterium]|nr:hypothetical protein [Cyclobacteriaceae bacterium]